VTFVWIIVAVVVLALLLLALAIRVVKQYGQGVTVADEVWGEPRPVGPLPLNSQPEWANRNPPREPGVQREPGSGRWGP